MEKLESKLDWKKSRKEILNVNMTGNLSNSNQEAEFHAYSLVGSWLKSAPGKMEDEKLKHFHSREAVF